MITREHALEMTPPTAFGVGILFGLASMVAIWNLPDSVLDHGVRLLNRLHGRP